MSSRFLERLNALIGASGDPYEKACLSLDAASYLARRGDHLDSARMVQGIRDGGLHLSSPRVSAWLNFAEGMQFHCRGYDQEARVKWHRCIAIARAGRSTEVLGRALTWLAFCDYTNLRIDSLFTCMREAVLTLGDESFEARARSNMTLAQICHLCGNTAKAKDFYDKSRIACLANGDDVMLSTLIHNMAWLRMAALRNDEVRGIHVRDDANIVALTAESTRNYEDLIGAKAFDVMTPLLGAQVDILRERYADAIQVIGLRQKDLNSQGLSRLSAVLIADRAYCRGKLGDLVGARSDTLTAIGSISSEDHVDDLAVLYARASRVFEMIGEPAEAARYKLMSEAMWVNFESLQSRMLIEVDCLEMTQS